MPGRTRGSCRFETYYQVQVRDEMSAAWKTVKGNHATEKAAHAAAPAGKYRVATVSEAGRSYSPIQNR